MNFQQILIIFFLPYLVSSSEIVKRNVIRKRKADIITDSPIAKVSKRTENVYVKQVEAMNTCEDMLIYPVDELDEQDTIRNAQIAAHNQSCPILKLPEELNILIYSYLRCPYSNLPSVCRLFNENMKKYPLNLHFSFISSIKNTIPLKPSKDLARLMKLDNKFFNEDLDQLLSVRTSYFSLDSPLLTAQVVKFMQRTFESDNLNPQLDKLAHEMLDNNHFDSFLVFLKLLPNYKIHYYQHDFCKFLKFLKNDESTFLSNVEILVKSVYFPDAVLKSVFSLPDIADLGSILSCMDLGYISKAFMLKSIAESFSLLDFNVLTDDQIEFIQERNGKYINQYSNENASTFMINFAKFCSELISPNCKDKIFKKEFFEKLEAYVNASSDNDRQKSGEICCLFDILFRIAIKRGYLKLFTQLVNTNLTSKHYIITIESRMNLKDYPQFVASFSLTLFRKIYGYRNIFALLKHRRLSLEEVSKIKDTEVRLAAQIELESDNDAIENIIKHFAEKKEFMLPFLIRQIINQSSNPARTIHKVFDVLKDHDIYDEVLLDICGLLGTRKYLQSLFNPGNEDVIELPLAGLYINLDAFSFKSLLELSKTIGTRRIKPVLKNLVIDWKSIVGTEGLLASDFDSFFKILGLNISSYEVIKNKSKEDRDAIASIRSDSRCLFVDPKVDPKYIFEVLLIEVDFAYCDELRRSFSTIGNETNPFRMKFFGIYEFIMEKNIEAFVSLVPDQVFSAFKPKIPNYLVKKALMNPVYRKNFADRILLQSFPPNTVHNISISSIDELKVYTTTFYPELYMYYYDKFYLNVYIDWETIINSAETEIELLFIMKYLDPKDFEEKVLVLNQTSKIKEFISFYYQNRDFISLEQIDQRYLDAFTYKSS